MTTVATLVTEIRGQEVGLSDMLARVQAQSRQTDQAGQALGATFTRMQGPQQQTAEGALQLAQAEARLAVAMGEPQRAAQILNTALTENVGASDRATLGIQTQIARLESGRTTFQQFGDAAKSSLLSIIGPAALVAGAIRALQSVVNEAEEGFKLSASLDQSRASLEVLLRGVRDSNEVFAGAARFGQQYKLTQQEIAEATQASSRIIRNSKAPVEDILGAFARLRVLAPEKTFSDAARALSELQAGQVVSIEHLFNVPRADANQMKKEIEGGADAVQVLNRFLDRSGVTMEAVAKQSQGAAGQLKEAAVQAEKFQLALSGGSGGPGAGLLEFRINLLKEFTAILSGDFSEIEERNRRSAAAQEVYNNTLASGKSDAEAYANAQRVLNGEMIGLGGVFDTERQAVAQSAATHTLAGAATAQHTHLLEEHQAGTLAATSSTFEFAAASQADAAAKQLQALQTQLLNEQAQITANAFLAANPAINASGIQSAVTAGAISPLIGRLAELTLQIRQAKAELGGIAAGRPETGGDAIARSLNGAAASQRFLAEQTERAAEAQRQQVLATGAQAQKVKILKDDYDAAVRSFGRSSAEAINAETKLIQAQQAGGRGAKAAGATRLSDQTKLNNSLLADQDRYQDQAEAAEREHYKNVLKIQADYERKSLEQQRANEISKRSSELDFLKSITSSELNETKSGRAEIQRINERFYADFAEAQAAAQAGNAKLSEELVNQAKERAAVEQQYAEQIEQAKKDKDASEVARLTALREKERQILDEQRKQLLEGGDANAKAKQEALDAEDARFNEQQGKNATAAEQATQRKVDAAQRSGKAVTEENSALLTQERILNRIGPRQPGGVQAPAAPVGATPAVTAPIATGAPTDLAALADALRSVADQITTAIDGAKAAIVGAQDKTTGAVRGLEGRALG